LTEWEEVEAAVEFVIQRGASEVVLTGFSTGAALAMSFLEQSSKTHPVRGVVFDAPNVILAEAIRLATTEAKTTSLMIEFGMWIADLRWRIDWNATNYVQRATTILQVPTLVFHGTADRTVPITVSLQLATRLPDLVELVETPAAGHVMSWNADPERYERYLGRFLSRL
jgi:alpha-beta hydrolase superfamily lysophospholipase